MKWLFEKKLKNKKFVGEVEKIFKIEFPDDYKKIIRQHNAGMPSVNTIDTRRQTGKAFGELLNFNLGESGNIITIYKEIKDKLPEKVFPITMDSGGNFLCFDFRDDKNKPKVVRWDHEQKFVIVDEKLIIPDHQKQYEYYHLDFVADSFTAVLTDLYGVEEVEKNLDEVIWEDFLSEEKLKEFDDGTIAQVNIRLAKKGLPPIVK